MFPQHSVAVVILGVLPLCNLLPPPVTACVLVVHRAAVAGCHFGAATTGSATVKHATTLPRLAHTSQTDALPAFAYSRWVWLATLGAAIYSGLSAQVRSSLPLYRFCLGLHAGLQ